MPANPIHEQRAARRGVGLDVLFADLSVAVAYPGGGVTVRGITLDSRLVRPGDLYVALPGRAHHGARFAAEAVANGAVAVLTDEAGAALAGGLGRPVVVAADPRRRMGPAAAEIFGHPSRSLTTYAITGTNGKTTTASLLEEGLRAAGRTAGVIGTLGFSLGGRPLEARRTTVTTPEAPELQALLAAMRDDGATAVVMEVSSHALAIGRVAGIEFDVAAFTNLGRDHLDFHGTVEAYFAAKAQLFTAGQAARAVINLDDGRGPELVALARAEGLQVLTLSLTDPSADVTAVGLAPAPHDVPGASAGTLVRADIAGESLTFVVGLPGEFNIRNALTALAMLSLTGVALDPAAQAMAAAQVPGRMQAVPLPGSAPLVVVDFAHTPQAVSSALRALPAVDPDGRARRRIVVLGCGGDRDPDKRGPMGEAAAADADVVVVTDDNPRSEPPERIRAEVLAGARRAAARAGSGSEVVDGGPRRAAIRLALRLAEPGDVVAILGKGHETGQEVAGVVHPFSDPEVARQEWDALHPAPIPAEESR